MILTHTKVDAKTDLFADFHWAPKQHLHLAPRGVLGRRLDLALHHVRRVVHHDVEPPEMRSCSLERCGDLRAVSHGHRDDGELCRRVLCFQGSKAVGATRGGDGAVASGEHVLDEGSAQAGRAACD